MGVTSKIESLTILMSRNPKPATLTPAARVKRQAQKRKQAGFGSSSNTNRTPRSRKDKVRVNQLETPNRKQTTHKFSASAPSESADNIENDNASNSKDNHIRRLSKPMPRMMTHKFRTSTADKFAAFQSSMGYEPSPSPRVERVENFMRKIAPPRVRLSVSQDDGRSKSANDGRKNESARNKRLKLIRNIILCVIWSITATFIYKDDMCTSIWKHIALPYLVEIGVLQRPLSVWESLLNAFGMLAQESVLDRMQDALLRNFSAQITFFGIIVGSIVCRVYLKK